MKLLAMFDGREDRPGFSVAEILIVLAIGIVMLAAGVALSSRFFTSSQLNDIDAQLAQTLRTAAQRSAARYNTAAHGVYVASDQFILYQGSTYATRDTSLDRITTVASGVTLSTSIPGSDIRFTIGTGVPTATGTVSVVHDVDGTRTIEIRESGFIASL